MAHADPAGDFPALALALNFELVTATARSGRTIAIDRFFRELLTTALRPNEILTEVHIPALPAGTGVSYQKLPNKASHYAVVGVAAAITVGDDGVCMDARIGVTGAGATAVRARNTERILKGKHIDAAVIRRAAKRAGANVEDFNDDLHASAEYREHLTTVFAARAIEEALSRALGEGVFYKLQDMGKLSKSIMLLGYVLAKLSWSKACVSTVDCLSTAIP